MSRYRKCPIDLEADKPWTPERIRIGPATWMEIRDVWPHNRVEFSRQIIMWTPWDSENRHFMLLSPIPGWTMGELYKTFGLDSLEGQPFVDCLRWVATAPPEEVIAAITLRRMAGKEK